MINEKPINSTHLYLLEQKQQAHLPTQRPHSTLVAAITHSHSLTIIPLSLESQNSFALAFSFPTFADENDCLFAVPSGGCSRRICEPWYVRPLPARGYVASGSRSCASGPIQCGHHADRFRTRLDWHCYW